MGEVVVKRTHLVRPRTAKCVQNALFLFPSFHEVKEREKKKKTEKKKKNRLCPSIDVSKDTFGRNSPFFCLLLSSQHYHIPNTTKKHYF